MGFAIHLTSLKIFLPEILRITVKNDERRDITSSSRDQELEHDQDRDRDGETVSKKPRYRSYTGGVVVEEVVKLSEKVVVPVKEYPNVNSISI